MRGTALAEGIGEALSPLPPMVKCPVLIAKPSISVSTKFVYQNLKLDDTTIHPDIDLLIDDIKAKNLHDIAAHMGNVLETVTIPNYPVIDEIKKHMLSKALSGGDKDKADELLNAFKKGFSQATGAWGDKLPSICQDTYDAVLKKFDDWKNGTEDTQVQG